MKVTKRVHSGYKEWEHTLNRGIKIRQFFGKYQYIYKQGENEISLIELKNYFFNNKDIWEIYCIKGDIFEDIERFNNKMEAEKRIKELFKV